VRSPYLVDTHAMPSKRLVDPNLQQAKRELRAQSARLRRRVNADIHGMMREQTRLRSWRTWVRRFPLPAIAAAFGVGLAASMGIARVRAKERNIWQTFLSRWAVPRLMQWATSAITSGMLAEVLKVWTGSANPGAAARGPSAPSEQV
jgi:hypothetical protein